MMVMTNVTPELEKETDDFGIKIYQTGVGDDCS
jgi:hypothetical protein